ncbi:heavy metal-binding domain-containing protein [Alteromonas sp. 5E99-2]|uniref:YbjQ family protein n=1 Tax=Alteromonas sp. 5E99-2 TaxID=2817683 RepID=UPI001A9804E5|nr:heavy metal-binding domain-containing protein [Alteromonas sp. 5E99-2]MBO1255295.1 heavy metal-binding domain-containing protein [Alteromonas sp. 5E99-2]
MLQIAIIVSLLLLGYVFGRHAEAKHYRYIEAKESELLALPATNLRTPLNTSKTISHTELVTGNVVISVDYFKRMLATLRALVGGEINAYETLVDRARREAIIRLKTSCLGASEIINLRLETSSISKGGRNQIGSVEVLAYGTAIYYQGANTEGTVL